MQKFVGRAARPFLPNMQIKPRPPLPSPLLSPLEKFRLMENTVCVVDAHKAWCFCNFVLEHCPQANRSPFCKCFRKQNVYVILK